jgi:superfamily II DNA or RNA helicase
MSKVSPVKLILPLDDDAVRAFLTFSDRSVEFLIHRHSKNYNWKRRNPETWIQHSEALKKQRKTCILFRDEDGNPWTYSGLEPMLQKRFGWGTDQFYDNYVEPKLIPWNKTPPPMRFYQREAVEALINNRHGAIELPTGSGKSLILLNICKHYGQKTVIVSPSSNVTRQLYNAFVTHFGLKYTGMFSGAKKQFDKLFTVCTVQSLMNLKPGSREYEAFSTAKVFLFDESHTASPDEFQKVSLGVCANVPVRFFVSATQIRTDGSEMVLKGITGNVVYSKGFRELADLDFLARPVFKMFHVPCSSSPTSADPKTETRNQLYTNPQVIQMAAKIASQMVLKLDKQVLILIEEFKQFSLLMNYLNVPFEFVHGPISDVEKEKIPQQYWKSDTEAAIGRFNRGETRVLIGTSAISTGVDLFPVNALIYLQGGISEIKVKQSLGRGTRPTKKDFFYIDFNVVGSATMERHFWERVEYYKEMSDDITHYGAS